MTIDTKSTDIRESRIVAIHSIIDSKHKWYSYC